VAQLYLQALGSLSVTSCDSQDDDGGIQTCLHRGLTKLPRLPSLYSLSMDRIESTALDSSSIVACINCHKRMVIACYLVVDELSIIM
jgi:hypothetical protein